MNIFCAVFIWFITNLSYVCVFCTHKILCRLNSSPIPKRKTNSISLCSQASDQLLANKITHSRTNTHKCITSKCDYMQQITEEWKYISFVLSLWFLFFFRFLLYQHAYTMHMPVCSACEHVCVCIIINILCSLKLHGTRYNKFTWCLFTTLKCVYFIPHYIKLLLRLLLMLMRNLLLLFWKLTAKYNQICRREKSDIIQK